MAAKPVKVSQLNSYIGRILQTDPLLGNLSVIGEVSNLKFHGSGHVYFSLKDTNSKLNCFLAADKLKQIRYELTEGMEIIASGYISVYQRGGTYSLHVADVSVEGMGSLSLAFNQLKERLEKEGLFKEDHKKPIPDFPKKIAIITSETGAALQDILKIIKNRNDYVDVLIYPVLVQGPEAAPQIANAIKQVNLLFPQTDTIITGRGGGSMEELWAFNEEIVARSIYNSKIPVISAVGHEIDVTIADFVADKRAETPTAAAHIAVPDTGELRRYLNEEKDRMHITLEGIVRYKEIQLQNYCPEMFQKTLLSLIQNHKKTIDFHKVNLDSLNPRNIMKRGYGAITDSNGKMIGSVASLNVQDPLTVIFNDGETDCRVTQVRRNNQNNNRQNTSQQEEQP